MADLTPEPWEHLKKHGYAPGGYMSKCHRCGATPIMDKQATTCRRCAEKLHAAYQSIFESIAKEAEEAEESSEQEAAMADQLRDLLTRIVSRERHRGTVLLDADELCAIETALAQAEPVQFDPAEALRLAEEFAQMKQAHGYFCNAGSRRLMEEAHSALAAYLGIKGGGNG